MNAQAESEICVEWYFTSLIFLCSKQRNITQLKFCEILLVFSNYLSYSKSYSYHITKNEVLDARTHLVPKTSQFSNLLGKWRILQYVQCTKQSKRRFTRCACVCFFFNFFCSKIFQKILVCTGFYWLFIEQHRKYLIEIVKFKIRFKKPVAVMCLKEERICLFGIKHKLVVFANKVKNNKSLWIVANWCII